jgi:hypothetical protein
MRRANPLHHEARAPVRGDITRAFDLALATLTGLGFRLDRREPARMQFSAPGYLNSKHSPLLGASRITLSHRAGELVVEAELHAVRRLARFAIWFPIAVLMLVGVPTAMSFAWLWPNPQAAWAVAVACGVNAALWAVAGPLLGRLLLQRTREAVTTLAINVARS